MHTHIACIILLVSSTLGVAGCAQAPVSDASAPQSAAPVQTQPPATVPVISQDALLNRLAAGDASLLVIDVRSPQEYAQGHVPGAINMPHDTIGARLDELRATQAKGIVLYCESGKRAGMATETLRSQGLQNLQHLEGHMQQWRARGREQAQ